MCPDTNCSVLKCSWVIPIQSQDAQLPSPHNSSSLARPNGRTDGRLQRCGSGESLLYVCCSPPCVPSVHPQHESLPVIPKVEKQSCSVKHCPISGCLVESCTPCPQWKWDSSVRTNINAGPRHVIYNHCFHNSISFGLNLKRASCSPVHTNNAALRHHTSSSEALCS